MLTLRLPSVNACVIWGTSQIELSLLFLFFDASMSFVLEKENPLVPKSTFEIKWTKLKMVICAVHGCTRY